MIRKIFLTALVGAGLAISASAEVVVTVAPPRPIVERRIASPGRGYVWTPGFHRWDGRAYVWAPGAWVLPPRPRAVWVPAKWVRRPVRGWVFVEGHWR
ncbi:MAG: YXWGXW repeat-containing protein [Bryobacteraceae bacterium]